MAGEGTVAAAQHSQGIKKDKPVAVRETNLLVAKSLGDAIRTSLGPKGMDKMIINQNKHVTISNDGATLLEQMFIVHPIGQMLVDCSKAQDIEAGDGTTTVVVLATSLLDQAQKLINKGFHPSLISFGYQMASEKALEVLNCMGTKIELSDRETLLKNAVTSLSSKVVSQYSNILAGLSVDAVLSLVDDISRDNITVDLKDIKVVDKLGGTIEDTELVKDGVVLIQHFSNNPTKTSVRVENAKVAMLQFCISPPKTDMESNVIVTDYTQMDRIMKEERLYILKICKAIKSTGCTVLLLQKSILRDAITEIGLHYLTKMNILVVKNIERDEVEHICNNIGCRPIASINALVPENLANVGLVEEVFTGLDKYIKISGLKNARGTSTIIVRGSNRLVLDEARRSIHDALCVVRALVKSRSLIVGGGAPETEVSMRVKEYSQSIKGAESFCVRAFAEAFEVVPITLAENAGLNAVTVMSELRRLHASGLITAGVSATKNCAADLLPENVLQPLLVSTSAVSLATEVVRCILKIDDILRAVR